MINKKKVLHISHSDIRTDSRILKEIKVLRDSGLYEVAAIGVDSRDLSRVQDLDGVRLLNISLAFTKFKWRPSFIRHGLALIELSIKLLKAGRKLSPDVIHCHDTLALGFGWLLAKASNAKLIYDAHELESARNGQSRLNSNLTLRFERMVWSEVDLLVTVSPSIIDWYQFNIGQKKSVLVLNSPTYTETVGHVNSEKSYLRDKFRVPKDKKIFIYVGMLLPGRGIYHILDAFKESPQGAHIVFLGFGVLAKDVLNAAKQHDNIHFHDAVPHDEVVGLVKGANVGLCVIENISLSDYYCLPNKLFEYAFSGLPVVASNFPDLKAVVEEHHLGRCVDVNSSAIAKVIDEMSREEGLSRAVNLDKLAWGSQANRLLQSYASL